MRKGYKTTCDILLVLIGFSILILVMYFQRTYTVTFDTKGGTIYASAEVKAGDKAIKPADPIMEGYIFMGWYVGDTEEKYDFSKPVTESIVITAKWEAVT